MSKSLIGIDTKCVFFKICNTNTNDNDSAAQCDICQSWIHMICNNLNYIDYKYLQGSNDPWFCISCVMKSSHLEH